MWHNHQALNFLANLLLAAVVLAVFYTINVTYLKLELFPINEISVHSLDNNKLDHVSLEQIAEIAHNEIIENLLTVDLVGVRKLFERLPWVRSVVVHKNWPNGLEVLLEEHEVLARWYDGALVNTYGEIYWAILDGKLPVFVGPAEESAGELMRRYHNFNKILQPLQQSIAEIHLSPRHAWRVSLETGTTLELGRIDMEMRLAYYRSVYYQSIAELNQQMMVEHLDFRYANGFSARIPEIVQQTPEPDKPSVREKI